MTKGAAMQTHHFKVIIRPDEECWQADCPALQEHGAYTWGYTREEALGNIQEVIGMILAELVEDGLPIPGEPADLPLVAPEQRVAVSV